MCTVYSPMTDIDNYPIFLKQEYVDQQKRFVFDISAMFEFCNP